MVILCHKRCEDVLPHISVSTPSTDLCFVCQNNNLAIQQSSSLSDEAKAERLATAQEYLSLAHKERQYYKSKVKVAVNAFESQDEADKPYISHCSYDFAQQVHFPFSTQLTGPEYFKTARKCGIFGVYNDGDNTQVTYLIDAAENPGYGADCVISLLHHYLEIHGAGEKCHADNCVGPNKNNTTIQC